MIVIYPMYTSNTVSPSVIPGITKAVERYILVYGIDSVTRSIYANTSRAINIAKNGALLYTAYQAAKTVLKKQMESEFIDPNDFSNFLQELEKEKNEKPSKSKESRSEFVDKVKSSKVDLMLPNMENISLEPTWVKLDDGTGFFKVIGVKVVPIPIKSDKEIIAAILNDQNVKGIQAKVLSAQRKIVSLFFKLCRKIPAMGNRFLSDDIKKDLIWGTSKYGKDIFLLLNFSDLENEVVRDFGGIDKLQKLGWPSVIMADDVNRRAIFCMRGFKGLCSTLQYQFLYAGLGKSGKEYGKVYDDLEDVRKSASPFFRMSAKSEKFIGESVGTAKLKQYRDLLNGK